MTGLVRLPMLPVVTLGSFLQIAGAVLELAGIFTVALGISRTRTRFGRPSMAQQSLASMRRFAARFRRKKQNVVVGVGSARATMKGGRAYGTALHGSFPEDVTLEDRIERLRATMNRHSESLTRLERTIDDEREERQKTQEEADRQRAELATRLEGIIEDLAVGSLRLETLGVFALALGVICSTVGNLIS